MGWLIAPRCSFTKGATQTSACIGSSPSSGTLARAAPGAGLRRGATGVARSARNLHGRAHEFSLFRPDYCSRVCFCAWGLSEHFIVLLALAEISKTVTMLLRRHPRDAGIHVRPLAARHCSRRECKTCNYIYNVQIDVTKHFGGRKRWDGHSIF